MDEKIYREKFEVHEGDIRGKWGIIQSVFKVPNVENRYETDEWARFPAQIFQESCELALLDEDFFATEYLFSRFRDFLIGVDEEHFLVMTQPGSVEGASYELFCYPTGIKWAVLSDDNSAALAEVLSVLNHYVIGESGKWGMFWIEPWTTYVVGYKDQSVLRVLQSTYDFEGRGADVVDSLPKEREAKRLHEIANQIRVKQ
jgi:hypothetical protein